MLRKIAFGTALAGVALATLPLLAAFEAHVVNVTARIENALSVPIDPINFGTVFPQEQLDRTIPVSLSQSFLDERRVDDVEYIIRQKPKCALTNEGGTQVIGPTATGHVVPNGQGGYSIDCGPAPLDTAGQPLPGVWGPLPSLCQYLSKHELTEDGQETNNDGSLNAFHVPFTVSSTSVTWLDTRGRLAKSAPDTQDLWNIDLKVPCFGGYCAQDWADFVHGINPDADPTLYTQPIGNEHKVFGCDLWLEVTGVSEAEI